MLLPTGRLLTKISRNAFSGRYGYFRAKWRTVTEERILFAEANALLAFLRRSGCTFHRCADLYRQPVPRGISYRYDVHVRDIPGCRSFVEFHRKERIPATFFFFWDYSPLERKHFQEYKDLRKLIAEPSDVGHHDSPVDAFLIANRFRGNRREYATWADSEGAVRWLTRLAEDPVELARFNDSAMTEFIARVRQAQVHFGPISLIAGHGGELGQLLRKKLPKMKPAAADIARNLRARYWLTPNRLAAAGLDACVDRNDHSPEGWFEASDDGGLITKMARLLRRRLDQSTAVQLLLHPYTWAGGKRDAELSELLNSGAAVSPVGALAK